MTTLGLPKFIAIFGDNTNQTFYDVNVANDLGVSNTFTVGGNSILTDVSATNMSITNNLNIGGNLDVDNINITGVLDISAMICSNDAYIGNNLNVIGQVTANHTRTISLDISQTTICGNVFTYDSVGYKELLVNQPSETTRLSTHRLFNPTIVTSLQTIDIIPSASSGRYIVENSSDYTGATIRIPFQGISSQLDHMWIQNASPSASITIALYDSAGVTSGSNNIRQLSNPHTTSSSYVLDSEHTLCLNAFRNPTNENDIIWNFFEFN